MKKIAIITFPGYTGSTIPLAKHFAKNGFVVDFYIISSKTIDDIEAASCKIKFNKFGMNSIDDSKMGGVKAYMGNDQFSLYSISLPRPYKSIPLARNIMSVVIKNILGKVIKTIASKEYSFVNLVGRFDSFIFLNFLDKIENCVVSLHEVSAQKYFSDMIVPNKLISFLIKKDIPIIVYSANSLKDIKGYDGLKQSNVSQINFGLFESYKTIENNDGLKLPENYILYYGFILPYKGLSILYDAINILGDKISDTKIVIAGAGNDDVLEKIKSDERYVVINRYLSNNDIVTLNKRCKLVVCPYLRMSQSGIPQTTYVFDKPVIASDLPAFREVIKHGQNGLLFEPGNSEMLANCIDEACNNPVLFSKISEGAGAFSELNPDFDWNNIIQKYLKFCQ